MTLDTLQQRFVDELINGQRHMILTGKAGTGKSTALCAGVKAALECGKDVEVMAPTAMAASIHRDAGLESGTIHHALKWNPAREPLPRKLLAVGGMTVPWNSKPDQDRILIVDEASMVGLWLFEILARGVGSINDTRPFDGRRLVLVGDWAQLPPVVGSEEQQMARQMPELEREYGPADGCVLYHRMFRMNPPIAVILEETHRANGEWFEKLNLLRDCTRAGTLGWLGMSLRTLAPGEETDSVYLCFRRTSAHQRNTERLERLPGKPICLPLRDGQTTLKTDCEVLVTSNRAGSGYINGSRAVFSGLNDVGAPVLDGENPIQMLADGNWSNGATYQTSTRLGLSDDHVEAGRTRATSLLSQFSDVLEADAKKWLTEVLRNSVSAERFGSGRTVFQPYFPILPGYAITVHKAQGMTLTKVAIENDVFWSIAPARLPYVALSRVADGNAIELAGFSADRASVRPDASYPALFARIRKWSITQP